MWIIHPIGAKMSEAGPMEKICGRCGHVWNSLKDQPVRCPSCGTYHWSGVSHTNSCKVCGHTWFSRSTKTPLRCPRCKTRSWASGNAGRRNCITFDDEISKKIIDMYMMGTGCVEISITTGVAVSRVIETIRCGVCDGRQPRM